MVIMMTTLAVASMGIPYAAITSPYIVMVLRIIVGLASVSMNLLYIYVMLVLYK